ncbi:hypothetical protein UY3_05725 [Chelonia mydas]|uniref:Uncharacterized protein n=1 Tax=Chelonia mydas TaxID=8469 RepID=M7BJ23_CHEMY|nr:hypothetical protein UY3_05725 [Chelonia mydas]
MNWCGDIDILVTDVAVHMVYDFVEYTLDSMEVDKVGIYTVSSCLQGFGYGETVMSFLSPSWSEAHRWWYWQIEDLPFDGENLWHSEPRKEKTTMKAVKLNASRLL